MRAGATISTAAHIAILVVATVTFSSAPPKIPTPPPMSVALLTTSDETKLAAGVQNAPQSENQQPLVERVGESRPVEDPNARVVNEKEITAATEASAPPPLPKPKQAVKNAEPKTDPIAEAIKKDQRTKKVEQKKIVEHPPMPPKRPQQQQQHAKYDPRLVKELLDRRAPQRKEASGAVINHTVALGAPSAASAQLTQNELDALRARLAQLWNPPAGAQNPQELVVEVRMQLKPDGTLASPPTVLTSGHSPMFMAARDSAMRAVFRGQPFDMLRPETYEQWKDIVITFDPRDMIRG
jgi:colicin import membrane protein